MTATLTRRPLFDGAEWTFELMDRTYEAIAEVAHGDLGLDTYPNQVEIITTEQMLDAYASFGLPLMYRHWSFGKRFVRDHHFYRKGLTGLAYEIVINSNPCISYNLENNTMALQALVMAHAAFGHNHFFKNNYLFREWTDADSILDDLQYAKSYLAHCEERYGFEEVERVLDAAHALMDHAVFRYRRPPEPTERELAERRRAREEFETRSFNDLWRTVPRREPDEPASEEVTARDDRTRRLKLPEENLLWFVERHSPVLEPWQREVLSIVRQAAQYFYPQRQTKVMNEGCATFVHHYICNALYDKGLLTDGAMLEILHNHANVVFQPEYDDPRYQGLNPYALGFAMMQDIRRICEEPDAEDREWFPELAGSGDWRAALRRAWADFRDESFIRQYLSPRMIRKFRLFVLRDDAEDPKYTVSQIHDDRGFRRVRDRLAASYDPAAFDPDVQVSDCDLRGSRRLDLVHTMRDGVPLEERERDEVLRHLRTLWGYDVRLTGVREADGAPVYESRA